MAKKTTTTYRGNCHCGAFRFIVDLPGVMSATACDCDACAKNGFLWCFPDEDAFRITHDESRLRPSHHGKQLEHKFCSVCGTGVVGTHTSGPLTDRFGVNIRTLLGVNPFAVAVKKHDGAAHAHAAPEEAGTDTDGMKTYKGSCTCGAIRVALRSKPLPQVEVKEDNCSICVRNGWVGVYPLKSQVTLAGAEHATEYRFGRKFNGSPFCKFCAVNVYGNLYGPPPDVVEAMTQERKDMVEHTLQIQPLNVRVLDGVEWGRIQVEKFDEGTEGYAID